MLQAWGCLHGHLSVLAGPVLNAVACGIGHAHEQLREGQAVVTVLQAEREHEVGLPSLCRLLHGLEIEVPAAASRVTWPYRGYA